MNTTKPELFEWQKTHVDALEEALRYHNVAKDGSDTGTGKTIMALETVRRLGKWPIVICPKSVIPTWREWYAEFYPRMKEFPVFNYEAVRVNRAKTKLITRHNKAKGRGAFTWNVDPDKSVVIFDEDHRCKNGKSLNGKLLIAARRQRLPMMLLGATSCTNPTEMMAMGYALGLHRVTDFWRWCFKNGCVRGHFGGLDFVNDQDAPLHLKNLHNHIYVASEVAARGSRLRTKEIPDFPETLITADSYAVDDPKLIDEVYDELALLEERKAEDEDPDNPLTAQLRARQTVELLKAPLFTNLASDAIEEGNAVAIFVSFRGTLDAVVKGLKKKGHYGVTIHGDDTTESRQEACDAFGKGQWVYCVATISAGGVGISLHDTDGERPRVALISPTFSAVDLKQALGRVHRAGAKSKSIQRIVFAAGTVEEKVCHTVRRKLNNLDLINDDELNPIL
jgi:SNF2 family DNA or RNA helicase